MIGRLYNVVKHNGALGLCSAKATNETRANDGFLIRQLKVTPIYCKDVFAPVYKVLRIVATAV